MSQHDFVLGIDFGGTKMALATADSAGTLLSRVVLPTLAEQGAQQAIDRALATGRQMVDETRAKQGGSLLAVGVSTMGITLHDRVLITTNVPGWEHLAIPHLVREAFGVETVRIENDVKAATFAELRWGALAGIDTGIYLNLGTGIASGLVVGGRVMRGSHGAAGEIAYNLRIPREKVGAQQDHAPLEEFAGGKSLAERAERAFGQDLSAVFRRARSEPAAREFIDATLIEIAFHLTNLTIALDPRRIAVGAGLMRSQDVILPFLSEKLRRFVPFPPELVAARFLLDAGLMGAVALALGPMPAI